MEGEKPVDEFTATADSLRRNFEALSLDVVALRVAVLDMHEQSGQGIPWTLAQATTLFLHEEHGAEIMARKMMLARPLLGRLLIEATRHAGRELDMSKMPGWIELLLHAFGRGKAFGYGGPPSLSGEVIALVIPGMIEEACHWPQCLDEQRTQFVEKLAEALWLDDNPTRRALLVVDAHRRTTAIRAAATAPPSKSPAS